MIKKKIYSAPETSTVIVVVESLLQGLVQNSTGTWGQTIPGDDSGDEGTDDDGRANDFVWDQMDDRL